MEIGQHVTLQLIERKNNQKYFKHHSKVGRDEIYSSISSCHSTIQKFTLYNSQLSNYV